MDPVELIRIERERQIVREGWSRAHDDYHDEGELAAAAACYALPDPMRNHEVRDGQDTEDGTGVAPELWPWQTHFWKSAKPGDANGRIRELVKAGALIVAEIERLQRAAAQAADEESAA